MSIEKTVDGRDVVLITDHLLVGVPKGKQLQTISDYIRKELQGKEFELGDGSSAKVNAVSRNKMIQPDEDMAMRGKMTKDLPDILKVSSRTKDTLTPDTKNHSFARDGFEYRKSTVQVGGKQYEVRINIGVNKSGKTFYTLNGIKEVPLVRLESPSSRGTTAYSIADKPNNVNDPTAVLKAEALKYKSAEEFVKAQGKPLYHGTPNKDFTSFDPTRSSSYSETNSAKIGHWFTNNKDVADIFTHDSIYVNNKNTKNGRIIEVYPDIRNPKVYEPVKDISSYEKSVTDIMSKIENLKNQEKRYKPAGEEPNFTKEIEIAKKIIKLEEDDLQPLQMLVGFLKRDKGDPYQVFEYEVKKFGSPEKYVQALKKDGYDGIVIKETGYDANGGVNDQIAVFNPEQIKTKEQLADIYNQAHNKSKASSSTSDTQAPVEMGRQSQLQPKIEQKTLETKVPQEQQLQGDKAPSLGRELAEATQPQLPQTKNTELSSQQNHEATKKTSEGIEPAKQAQKEVDLNESSSQVDNTTEKTKLQQAEDDYYNYPTKTKTSSSTSLRESSPSAEVTVLSGQEKSQQLPRQIKSTESSKRSITENLQVETPKMSQQSNPHAVRTHNVNPPHKSDNQHVQNTVGSSSFNNTNVVDTNQYVKDQVRMQQKSTKINIKSWLGDFLAGAKHALVDDSVAHERYITNKEVNARVRELLQMIIRKTSYATTKK